VLAARRGVVAAVVSHFSGGGARAHLAPRANFVAVRHDDGSYGRYYHLKRGGATRAVGDRVDRGDVIAYSGNTGYTGGPHLHFDVVNLLPEETSLLEVASGPEAGKPLASIAAAFSRELPQTPKRAQLRLFPSDVDWAQLVRSIARQQQRSRGGASGRRRPSAAASSSAAREAGECLIVTGVARR